MGAKRIGFDVDGVIYFWHEQVLEFAKTASIVPMDFTMDQFWGWPDGFFYGCSEPFKEMVTRNKSLYKVKELRSDVYDVLWKIAEHYDIFYLTARVNGLTRATLGWFKWSKLPNNSSNNIFMVDNGKRDLILAEKPCYYVEDRVEYIEDLKDITQVIHLVRPWSRHYYDVDVIRIENIKDLLFIIKDVK